MSNLRARVFERIYVCMGPALVAVVLLGLGLSAVTYTIARATARLGDNTASSDVAVELVGIYMVATCVIGFFPALTILALSRARFSPWRSLFIVVPGAMVGALIALLSVYYGNLFGAGIVSTAMVASSTAAVCAAAATLALPKSVEAISSS